MHMFCPTAQVFKELADFDVSDAFGVPKDDGHFWWPGLSSRRRRRSSVFPWHWDITKDARFAFTVRQRACTQSVTCLGKCSPCILLHREYRISCCYSYGFRNCVCVCVCLSMHVCRCMCVCACVCACMLTTGHRAGGDDRRGESEPPAERRDVHG